MIWESVIAPILEIAKRYIPDPQAQAQLALETQKLAQAEEFKKIDADLQMAQMQTDVNKEEAKNESIFVAGWRPYIGWICGTALGWHYIAAPFLVWGASIFGSTSTMPNIDLGDLFTLMLGMLGFGAMRSWDKKNETASGH